MKFLLDQGLPRSAAELLRKGEIDAVHTGECRLSTASDTEILDFARQDDRVVVTLDADFHAIMALTAARGPSVIRMRIQGLRSAAFADLLRVIIHNCSEDLAKGSLVSVTQSQIRVRNLPVGTHRTS